MSTPTESYLKVHYELRAAKQVERRMLMDGLQRLNAAGFPIRDYQYTGFGSVYFVDFAMMHRYFGLERLLSVEYSKAVEKRVRFNKPYKSVDIRIDDVGDVIPSLSRDLKHILWLDYDDHLLEAHVSHIRSACAQLSPGSVLLITVDVDPKGLRPPEWFDYYTGEAERYLDVRWEAGDFAASLLPKRNVQIIERVIADGLSGRDHVEFTPIFNFLYADGHEMLTIGGMITTDHERATLASARLERVAYARLRLEADPYYIRVPHITRKERLLLDGCMPCADEWQPTEFEMSPDDVRAYREIYRYFPAYAEMLL